MGCDADHRSDVPILLFLAAPADALELGIDLFVLVSGLGIAGIDGPWFGVRQLSPLSRAVRRALPTLGTAFD
jgi:hypothetical protein